MKVDPALSWKSKGLLPLFKDTGGSFIMRVAFPLWKNHEIMLLETRLV